MKRIGKYRIQNYSRAESDGFFVQFWNAHPDYAVEREIPSALLRAGSSLRLKDGSVQDDFLKKMGSSAMQE
jgi:hypothetical protein